MSALGQLRRFWHIRTMSGCGGNLGSADCPLLTVEDIGLNVIQGAQFGRAFLNRIKQCRRVATRYDKLAANYLAFIKRAAIRIWLRAYEYTP
jgi:transposase